MIPARLTISKSNYVRRRRHLDRISVTVAEFMIQERV